MIKATYNQSVLIILNPGKFHYICTIHVEIVHVYTMCIYIYTGMCYLCTIHIIAAYTSTNKENAGPSMSVSVYIYIIIYIYIYIYAYGYGICNNHVAYITRSSWDISIHLKDCYLYGIYIYTYCVLVARLLILYTIRFETTFSLSTNITWCLCTRSNNEDQVYTCSRRKKTTTGSLHIKHAGSCYFALCYIFEN